MDQAVHQEDVVTPSSKQQDMDIPGLNKNTRAIQLKVSFN